MKIIIDFKKGIGQVEKDIQRLEKMELFFQKPNNEIINNLIWENEYQQAFLLIKAKMIPNNIKWSELNNGKMELELW